MNVRLSTDRAILSKTNHKSRGNRMKGYPREPIFLTWRIFGDIHY
jgi:hypothetical protein